jgi:D-tyrosyl-tRNA(Tyr) deacylase
VYLGVGVDDDESDGSYLAEKIRHLRIFPDDHRPMNRDIGQAGGAVLAVSAFTTQADARRGRRPSFDGAAEPAKAERLYERFVSVLRELGLHVETGRFRATMAVSCVNDGPICLILDSKKQL